MISNRAKFYGKFSRFFILRNLSLKLLRILSSRITSWKCTKIIAFISSNGLISTHTHYWCSRSAGCWLDETIEKQILIRVANWYPKTADVICIWNILKFLILECSQRTRLGSRRGRLEDRLDYTSICLPVVQSWTWHPFCIETQSGWREECFWCLRQARRLASVLPIHHWSIRVLCLRCCTRSRSSSGWCGTTAAWHYLWYKQSLHGTAGSLLQRQVWYGF